MRYKDGGEILSLGKRTILTVNKKRSNKNYSSSWVVKLFFSKTLATFSTVFFSLSSSNQAFIYKISNSSTKKSITKLCCFFIFYIHNEIDANIIKLFIKLFCLMLSSKNRKTIIQIMKYKAP